MDSLASGVLEVQVENAAKFLDGLRQGVGAVRAGDDQFGLRGGEM